MCTGGSACDISQRYERVHQDLVLLNKQLEDVLRLMDEVNEQRRLERIDFDKLGMFEQFKRAMGWS